ncbi:hypothetical protein ACOMHN_008689 [Nucella lapillus]
MPGTETEDLTREGFEKKMRSRMFMKRVGEWWTCSDTDVRPPRSFGSGVNGGEGQQKGVMDHEKMFQTESALHQLRPEQMVWAVVEAEEAQWTPMVYPSPPPPDSLSWATVSSSSPPHSSCPSSPSDPPPHLGLLLLRHGTSVKKIHSYFSQLEFRKCCLHLAGRRSAAQSMRVVHESSSASFDDGSAKKSKATPGPVTHLEDKEVRVFRHAYLCATYPVLAAPDPPSPFSPSPLPPPPSTHQASEAHYHHHPPKSPYSLHDSGMEEAEDLAFIPSESICSHLQRAFRLTDERFRDYRHLINKSYVKKSAQKLLAEELTGQLSVLENNCHPFYRPHDFLPPLGYELWRKAEYSHITELLGKFWHFSLPFPRHTQDLMAELHTVHEDYRLLLVTLLTYEQGFHRQAEEEGGMLASPLSTASIRLLKEFGLRYGVGEQYRRVLYLDQITQDFSPSLCYLRHLLSVVNAIADLLPPNRRALAMVKIEYDLLMSSLLRLGAQVAKALEQIKSLFPGNKPVGAVELLIGLLQRVRDLRIYLQTNSLQPLPSLAATLTEIIQVSLLHLTHSLTATLIEIIQVSLLHLTHSLTATLTKIIQVYLLHLTPYLTATLTKIIQVYLLHLTHSLTATITEIIQVYLLHLTPYLIATLTKIIQGMFFQTYERCKTVIRTELRHSRDIHVCPRMLNALIMEVRQEVQDYRINFETVFRPYFDIMVLASRAFYSLLMKDVDTLCQQEILRDSAIDLRMLALIHRLNQLDQDWSAFIKAQEQSWRLSFQTHIAQWGAALQLHIQDLVLETIAGDAFVTQQLQLSSEGVSPPLSVSSLSGSPHTARSVSLTPSANSAFSSLGSVPSSTQNSSINSNRQAPANSNTPQLSTSTPTPTPTHPGQSPHPHPHTTTTTTHGKDFLSFADKRRHCASVPLLSERPAIVRVVSEVKMAGLTPTRGLQAASGMEDLRTSGEENSVVKSLKEGVGRDTMLGEGTWEEPSDRREGEEKTDTTNKEEEEEECHLLHCAGLRHDSDKGDTPSDNDQDSDSDSGEKTFTFPPLADVTDMNVSEACQDAASAGRGSEAKRKDWSSKSGAEHGGGKVGSVGKSGAPVQIIEDGRRRSAFVKGGGQEGRRRASDTAVMGQGQRGPRSCPPPPLPPPPPVQRQSSTGSASGNVTGSVHPSQATSLRKNSIVSMGTEGEQPFLQSIQSTVSFPTPTPHPSSHHPTSQIVIPVSGSAIDLLVLLQRTVGFGRTLCQAVFPPHLRARLGREEGMGVRVGMVGEEMAALRFGLQGSQTNAHFSIVKALCQGIEVYADNMLCLDLCAVPKDIAKRVIGLSLVEHAVKQQQQHKIWGCRHQLQGLHTCYAFHNRKATYLSECYEPISQKMCVRINNLVACQRYLDWCQKQTQGAHLHCPTCVAADSAGGAYYVSSGKPPTTSTSTLPVNTTPLLPPPPTASASTSGANHPDCGDGRGLKQQCVEETANHLMSVWTALCRLLAFRINLFLHDGLTLLLTLKAPEVPIATCLTPLTTFLRSHLDALSSWLYRHSFRRVIEFLWIYIVQDIEEEAGKLLIEKGRRLSPHLLLQTLMHLMKFMNNSEKGITRELLLSQADSVVTKLQLFTLSTLPLIALYLRLRDRYSEGDLMTQDDEDNVTRSSIPVVALHRLRRDLQTWRKCFSGAQLTHWIHRHGDLFLSPDELSLMDIGREGAAVIAQRLLDTRLIVDVEARNNVYSRVSSVASEQYPEVSLLDQLHGSASGADDNADDDDDRDDDNGDTHTPTPAVSAPLAGPQRGRQIGQAHRSAESSSMTPQYTQTASTAMWDSPSHQPSCGSVLSGGCLKRQDDTDGVTRNPHPFDVDVVIKDPVPSDPVPSDTRDPVPQSPDSMDPVPQSPESMDPVPQSSDTRDPVPQSPDSMDPVPQSPDSMDPVPQSPDTRDPVPQSPDSMDPVPQSPESMDPVPQSSDTRDPVPQSPDSMDPVPQSPESMDPVPQSSDTRDPVPQYSDTRDSVPQSPDSMDPVPQSPDSRDHVPQSPDSRDHVPQSPDSRDRVPQSPDSRDRVPSDTATRDPVPSDIATRDPMPSHTDTRDLVPSNTMDPVPQSPDSRNPVPSDTMDPGPQSSDMNTVTSSFVAQLSGNDMGKALALPHFSSTQDAPPGSDASVYNSPVTGIAPKQGDATQSSSDQNHHQTTTGKNLSEPRDCEPEHSSERKSGQAVVSGGDLPVKPDPTREWMAAEIGTSHGDPSATSVETEKALASIETEKALASIETEKALASIKTEKAVVEELRYFTETGAKREEESQLRAEYHNVEVKSEKEEEKVGMDEACSASSSRRVEVTAGAVLQTDSQTVMSILDLHAFKPVGEVTGGELVTEKAPRKKAAPTGGVSDLEDFGVGEGQDTTSEAAVSPGGRGMEVEGGGREGDGGETPPSSLTTCPFPTQLSSSAQPPANAALMPSYSQTAAQAPREGSGICDLDTNSLHGTTTPLSLASTSFNSLTSLFNSSADKFYFVPPSPTFSPTSPSSHPHHHHHHGASLPSSLEESLQHLKESEETSGLVEKCFTLKVTPTSLLMVLYSRRRTDSVARSFLEQLPPALQEQLASCVQSHSTGCSVL